METVKVMAITAVAVVTIGIAGLMLVYNAGKAITYHRPCGGGRHHG